MLDQTQNLKGVNCQAFRISPIFKGEGALGGRPTQRGQLSKGGQLSNIHPDSCGVCSRRTPTVIYNRCSRGRGGGRTWAGGLTVGFDILCFPRAAVARLMFLEQSRDCPHAGFAGKQFAINPHIRSQRWWKSRPRSSGSNLRSRSSRPRVTVRGWEVY